MFNLLVTMLIVMIVGYMAYSESKYLFEKPTGCKAVQIQDTIASAKSALGKAIAKVTQETKKIKTMLQQKKAVNKELFTPIENIQASTNVVMEANAVEDIIEENLPFSSYGGSVKIQKAVNGIIEGVRPPTYADPRTMNPALAAAPVQFSDPAMFGTFGVTDQSSLAFSTKDRETNAKIASDRTLEGFDIATDVYDANGAVLIMDGKIVKSAGELPSSQIKDSSPHTSLPMKSLHEPPPIVEDLVEGDMFDGLQGYPVNEKLDLLTPSGLATPMSEWAKIMYGI